MKSSKPKVIVKQDSSGRWRDGNGRFSPSVLKRGGVSAPIGTSRPTKAPPKPE